MEMLTSWCHCPTASAWPRCCRALSWRWWGNAVSRNHISHDLFGNRQIKALMLLGTELAIVGQWGELKS
eukprot:scaffold4678_cov18-Tisochrysis_lutea.AAC.1